MTNIRSEAWYSHAVARLNMIEQELKDPDLDMFGRYKLYSEELKLLEGVDAYERSKIEPVYKPLELRV